MVFFNIRLRSSEQLENGKYPIVLQITWRNEKNNVRHKRIGSSCAEVDWDFDNHCFKREAWGYVKQNAKIQTALEKAESVYRNMESWDYKKWSALLDRNDEKMAFTKWAEQLLEDYNGRGQTGTADHYRDAAKSLHNFLKKKTIYFEEITERPWKDWRSTAYLIIILRCNSGNPADDLNSTRYRPEVTFTKSRVTVF